MLFCRHDKALIRSNKLGNMVFFKDVHKHLQQIMFDSQRRLLLWITLQTTVCNCLWFLGRNSKKHRNPNWILFLETFLVWHLACSEPGCRKHTRTGVQGERWCLWAVGNIWGSGAVKQSRGRVSRCHGDRKVSPPALFAAVFFSFIDFFSSLFLSAGIVTWGTYWKFWLAQIWNRSPIFSSILKVSFFFPLYRSPLLISITWISYHNIINSGTLQSSHLSFTLRSSQRQKNQILPKGAAPLSINLPHARWNVHRISIRAELQQSPPLFSSSDIKHWSSAAV